jgi:biopolymer transport protein ExbD
MARKPTSRRSYKEESMDLDLTSMMNLIGILIPTLLIQTAFVEVAVIHVVAPSIGGGDESNTPPPSDEPPLNLRVTIKHNGYFVSATGLEQPVQIPLVQKPVKCGPYVGTTPPPRVKNMESGVCSKTDGERLFSVYDTMALTKMVAALKDKRPDERSVIIEGEDQTEYEAMTNAMDASRAYKTPEGELVELFPDVIIGGGVGG